MLIPISDWLAFDKWKLSIITLEIIVLIKTYL